MGKSTFPEKCSAGDSKEGTLFIVDNQVSYLVTSVLPRDVPYSFGSTEIILRVQKATHMRNNSCT